MTTEQPVLRAPEQPVLRAPEKPRRLTQRERERAARIFGEIEEEFVAEKALHDRMDDDWALWNLEEFEPDPAEGIASEDAITTNRPRVLAQKVIAFLNGVIPSFRVPDAKQMQGGKREVNDALEDLVVGMWANANRRRRRRNERSIQGALAAHATIMGGWVAMRAFLRKKPNGETFEDMQPFDPRHLVILKGEDEPLWCAYRTHQRRNLIRERYPRFRFAEEDDRDDATHPGEAVYDYYRRAENPDFDASSQDPFDSHPWVYLRGVLIDDQWAQMETRIFCLHFPVIAVPADEVPLRGPTDRHDGTNMKEAFAESIFAENRTVWDKIERSASYLMDLMGKASDPQKLVSSLDGTTELGDSANEKGSEIPLSTANQEAVGLMEQPDLQRAGSVLLQLLAQDEITGSLPPQAFGILDKPLSAVALRQLGSNLEHKVLPRMGAIEMVIEGAFEVMVGQFETGAFAPIAVAGRRFDNVPFSRAIMAEEIQGHDNLEIEMALTLPEDDVQRLQQAQFYMQPIPGTNETLGSAQFVRERILKMQSSDTIHSQNMESLARNSSPVALALAQFEAAQRTGDEQLIAITFDQLQLAALMHTVQIQSGVAQLMQAAQGVVAPPGTETNGSAAGAGGGASPNGSAGILGNPAAGGMGVAELRGTGNAPSPTAGSNTRGAAEREDIEARLAEIGLELGA